MCTTIYASPTPTIRTRLWEYLVELRERIQVPWLVLGDFNEVLNEAVVGGYKFVASRAELFS